jgi:hypothetical protein
LRTLLDAAVTVEIVTPGSLPADAAKSLSSRAGMLFSRPRLDWLWEDTRWTDLLVSVRVAGRLAGLLPLSVSRVPRWTDTMYDIIELTGDQRFAPSATCLIAGHADIRGSMLLDFTLPAAELHRVAEHAIRAALDFAGEQRCRCAAMYVADEEAELSAALDGAGMICLPAPGRNVIRWREPTLDSYLHMLSGSHRAIVRREWRKRAALGLEAMELDWECAIDAAAPLINEIQIRHGYASHTELVRRRLRRWGAVLGDRGFALRGEAAGRCTGYGFGWRDEGRITVSELAFQPGSPAEIDHATYLNLMIYTPLAICCRHGITALDLGIYADKPKRLRGAAAEPSHHWVQPD